MNRLILLFGIILTIDLYAFQGLRSLISTNKGLWYTLYWSVPVLVTILILFAIGGGMAKLEEKVPFFVQIRSFLFILYISKLLLILPLFIDDIRRLTSYTYSTFTKAESGGFWPERSEFLKSLAVLLGAIPLFTLSYGMINPFRFRKRYVSVEVEGLPAALEGFRIVQISDLHAGTFKDAGPFKKAVEMINQEKPDVVFFTGDLVNNRSEEANSFVPIFKEIQSRHGVFSILGNHDYGEYENWDEEGDKEQHMLQLNEQHKQMGWDLLRNESRSIEVEGSSINILGVENYSAFSFFPKYGDLDKTWKGAGPADFHILLSHDPTHWDEEVLEKFKNIDLTLSGHTHGFQFGIEIPGVVSWSPSQYVYSRWAGLYKEGQQYLYVNRGLGCLGYPGRVGILPEISIIELKNKK